MAAVRSAGTGSRSEACAAAAAGTAGVDVDAPERDAVAGVAEWESSADMAAGRGLNREPVTGLEQNRRWVGGWGLAGCAGRWKMAEQQAVAKRGRWWS